MNHQQIERVTCAAESHAFAHERLAKAFEEALVELKRMRGVLEAIAEQYIEGHGG